MTGESPQSGAHQKPSRRRGAPPEANVPGMENVRATAPDVLRRRVMERTRGRTVVLACVFAGLFSAVSLQLALATLIRPRLPRVVAAEAPKQAPPASAQLAMPPGQIQQAALRTPQPPAAAQTAARRARRAMIPDRNGEVLALSVPTYNVTVDPRDLIDPGEAARRLKAALPALNEAALRARLSDPARSLVYVARNLTAHEQTVIRDLRLPGVAIEPSERRRYPFGTAAAHLLGGVGADNDGIGGIEKSLNDRLLDSKVPLRLSIDLHVQDVVRDELAHAMAEFSAVGGCGLVMDVRTGEMLAMVSLPDFDPVQPRDPKNTAYMNRCTYARFEPGSTFKLQTVAMALDNNVVKLSGGFDATNPIRVGHHTINDFEGKHRYLSVPEIIAFSSNIGAARMAEAAGGAMQRAWMEKHGMTKPTAIELPEIRMPQYPAKNWGLSATLTIAFGQGIAVTPLHVVAGTAAVANGGLLLRPTLLAADSSAPPQAGTRVMQQSTSDMVRRLMRLVVTDGFGKPAEVPGYYVGGKTGTTEKIANGHYLKHLNVQSFTSVFPMNAPRYAVYLLMDEAKATPKTQGYSTAGWLVAPSVAKVINRAAPLMGMQPDLVNAEAIRAELAIPMQPGKGYSIPTRPALPPLAHTPAPVAAPSEVQALRQQITYRAPHDDGR